jgi:hypothetical protein
MLGSSPPRLSSDMLYFAPQPNVSPCSPRPGTFARGWRWLGAGVAGLVLSVAAFAAEPAEGDFGKDIQLAPFVVNGAPVSISIHARTKGDRRYAEEFAEDVVSIAYETIGKSIGAGLVIMGRDGEPHPVVVIRKFLAMAAAGQLDPAVAAKTGELNALIADWKAIMHLDENTADADDAEENGFTIMNVRTWSTQGSRVAGMAMRKGWLPAGLEANDSAGFDAVRSWA